MELGGLRTIYDDYWLKPSVDVVAPGIEVCEKPGGVNGQ